MHDNDDTEIERLINQSNLPFDVKRRFLLAFTSATDDIVHIAHNMAALMLAYGSSEHVAVFENPDVLISDRNEKALLFIELCNQEVDSIILDEKIALALLQNKIAKYRELSIALDNYICAFNYKYGAGAYLHRFDKVIIISVSNTFRFDFMAGFNRIVCDYGFRANVGVALPEEEPLVFEADARLCFGLGLNSISDTIGFAPCAAARSLHVLSDREPLPASPTQICAYLGDSSLRFSHANPIENFESSSMVLSAWKNSPAIARKHSIGVPGACNPLVDELLMFAMEKPNSISLALPCSQASISMPQVFTNHSNSESAIISGSTQSDSQMRFLAEHDLCILANLLGKENLQGMTPQDLKPIASILELDTGVFSIFELPERVLLQVLRELHGQSGMALSLASFFTNMSETTVDYDDWFAQIQQGGAKNENSWAIHTLYNKLKHIWNCNTTALEEIDRLMQSVSACTEKTIFSEYLVNRLCGELIAWFTEYCPTSMAEPHYESQFFAINPLVKALRVYFEQLYRQSFAEFIARFATPFWSMDVAHAQHINLHKITPHHIQAYAYAVVMCLDVVQFTNSLESSYPVSIRLAFLTRIHKAFATMIKEAESRDIVPLTSAGDSLTFMKSYDCSEHPEQDVMEFAMWVIRECTDYCDHDLALRFRIGIGLGDLFIYFLSESCLTPSCDGKALDVATEFEHKSNPDSILMSQACFVKTATDLSRLGFFAQPKLSGNVLIQTVDMLEEPGIVDCNAHVSVDNMELNSQDTEKQARSYCCIIL
jgi:hypothetical protein